MAVAKPKPPEEEEIDPEHPQYAHGMEAGLTAAGSLAGLPRPAPNAAMTDPTQIPDNQMAAGAQAIPGLNRRATVDPVNAGGAIGGLPRPMGPTPAVGGTQAILPPKIDPPKSLPRKRNQSAITQPNPADFFRS